MLLWSIAKNLTILVYVLYTISLNQSGLVRNDCFAGKTVITMEVKIRGLLIKQ